MKKNKYIPGKDPAITSFTDIMGGMPCVAGTRIPAHMIWLYSKRGYTIHEITEDYYPYLPQEHVIDVIEIWEDVVKNAREKENL
jgi:uncharacterized protein (DUF433 family)